MIAIKQAYRHRDGRRGIRKNEGKFTTPLGHGGLTGIHILVLTLPPKKLISTFYLVLQDAFYAEVPSKDPGLEIVRAL
jgi:hypothetical protein